MSNITNLLKRINTLLAVIEGRQQQQRATYNQVVLCNAAGEMLPGQEQSRDGVIGYRKRIILTHQALAS